MIENFEIRKLFKEIETGKYCEAIVVLKDYEGYVVEFTTTEDSEEGDAEAAEMLEIALETFSPVITVILKEDEAQDNNSD